MVAIFELGVEGTRHIGSAATLAEASASLPEGSYTTLVVRQGRRVLDFEHHVRRLAEATTGGAAVDPQSLALHLLEALRAERLDTARVRITHAPPRLLASIEPRDRLPGVIYERGVACGIVSVRRRSPGLKDTRFLAEAASACARLGGDVHEGLMVDADGGVLEGLSSNFFAILAGELWTAEEGVLPGVTRRRVLALAQGLMPIRLEPIARSALPDASEAFLTSASRGVLAVRRVDGDRIGDGRPGPATRKLGELLEKAQEREAVALADLAGGGPEAG